MEALVRVGSGVKGRAATCWRRRERRRISESGGAGNSCRESGNRGEEKEYEFRVRFPGAIVLGNLMKYGNIVKCKERREEEVRIAPLFYSHLLRGKPSLELGQ